MYAEETKTVDKQRAEARALISNLIRTMVAAVVEQPDEIDIKEVSGVRDTIYEVTVADSDVARALGRHHRTIDAMRLIVYASARRCDIKCSFSIVGNLGPRQRPYADVWE